MEGRKRPPHSCSLPSQNPYPHRTCAAGAGADAVGSGTAVPAWGRAMATACALPCATAYKGAEEIGSGWKTLRATQASYSLARWQNPTQSPWHTQHWPAYTLWQRS